MHKKPSVFQDYCLLLWRQKQYGELHRILVREVSLKYWKFVAELYALFGYMGQSAGFDLDWHPEEDYWPRMSPDAEKRLWNFLKSLQGDPIPLSLNRKGMEIFNTLCAKRQVHGHCVCWIPYHRILMDKTQYEACGARIFLEWLYTPDWQIGVQGLIAIYTEGLQRTAIQAEMTLRRRRKEM